MKKVFFFFIFFLLLTFPCSSARGIATTQECRANPGASCGDNYTCPENNTISGKCNDEKYPCCIPNAPSTTPSVSSSFDYTPLEEIPGQNKPADLSSYIKALYMFTLGGVGIAGILMVVIGGFFYVTSAGNSSRVEKGKEIITDALIGIVVAFFAYLVLYVINPDLVNLDVSSLSTLEVYEEDVPTGSSSDPPLKPPGGTEPAGSCGGMVSARPVQCQLASSSLSTMLKCMKDNGDTGTIGYVTSKAVGGDRAKLTACCGPGYSKSVCGHSPNSCHYGCKAGEAGQSHAVDYGITGRESDTTLCAIADRAKTCGAGKILGPKDLTCPGGGAIKAADEHDTHLHISTGACNG